MKKPRKKNTSAPRGRRKDRVEAALEELAVSVVGEIGRNVERFARLHPSLLRVALAQTRERLVELVVCDGSGYAAADRLLVELVDRVMAETARRVDAARRGRDG